MADRDSIGVHAWAKGQMVKLKGDLQSLYGLHFNFDEALRVLLANQKPIVAREGFDSTEDVIRWFREAQEQDSEHATDTE